MKKNVAAALAGALSLSLAAGVVAVDKLVSSKAGNFALFIQTN